MTALNHTGPLFQNHPSAQQSPVCEGSVGLRESPCLPWRGLGFSTGWPALFKNWLGCSETLFFKEKHSWTCSKRGKKKVRTLIQRASSPSGRVRVWKYCKSSENSVAHPSGEKLMVGVLRGEPRPPCTWSKAVPTSSCASVWGKTDVPGSGPRACLCKQGPRRTSTGGIYHP